MQLDAAKIYNSYVLHSLRGSSAESKCSKLNSLIVLGQCFKKTNGALSVIAILITIGVVFVCYKSIKASGSIGDKLLYASGGLLLVNLLLVFFDTYADFADLRGIQLRESLAGKFVVDPRSDKQDEIKLLEPGDVTKSKFAVVRSIAVTLIYLVVLALICLSFRDAFITHSWLTLRMLATVFLIFVFVYNLLKHITFGIPSLSVADGNQA